MRKRTSVPEGGVELGKVITPMLDLSFNILFFFVVMYHPSALEGHIDGKLLPPEETVAKGQSNQPMELPPLEQDPEIEDSYKVLVRAVKPHQVEGTRVDGDPSQIFLQRPETPEASTPVADTDISFADGLERLRGELKQILEAPGGSNTKIKLVADGNLKYHYLMEVYDVCRTLEIDQPDGNSKIKFAEVSFVGPAPLP